MRTRKVDSGGTVNYVCDGAEVASPVLADTNATYTPGLSERRGTTSKFYHSDALGSTRGITNASQSATDGLLYDAFGMTVSRTGTTPTPFGFVGAGQYQTDGDSGLMLLGHRYYDPSIGRFITQDPIQDGDNWYAYVDNNPLDGTDPQGTSIVPYQPTPHRRSIGEWFADQGKGLLDGLEHGAKWFSGIFAPNSENGCGCGPGDGQNNDSNKGDKGGKGGGNDSGGGGKSGRVSPKKLRKDWEEKNNKQWPKDRDTGGNQDAHHNTPRADGGSDDADNIEPMPRKDHIRHHQDNGDFKRWGGRRKL